MATIFTSGPDVVLTIGHYGRATHDRGVEVPEAVAAELEATYDKPQLLRIEREQPAAVAAADPEPDPPARAKRPASTKD